jgi:hypothetical protein
MERYKMLAIFVLFGAATTGCAVAVEPQQQSDQSQGLLTDIAVVRQSDGTYKRSIQKVTRAQRKAQVDARLERERLRQAGVQQSAQPVTSEIDNDPFCSGDCLWLYNQTNPDWGNEDIKCCVVGEGNEYISNLCGTEFGDVRALWPGASSGQYGDMDTWCGSSFQGGLRPDPIPYPDCPAIDWVQLDF